MTIRRIITASLAAVALSAGVAGTADAQAGTAPTPVRAPGATPLFKVVHNSAPMYVSGSMTGTIKFFLPLNTPLSITCWIGDFINGQDVHIRYLAGNSQYGSGWVWGVDVNTGHDPNPNIGYCS
jgi:hypothetical protein